MKETQAKVSTYVVRVRDKGSKKKITSYHLFKNVKDSKNGDFDIKKLFRSFIESFDGKFKGFDGTNQAMRITNNFEFNSKLNSISGFFQAGHTGEEKDVYKKNGQKLKKKDLKTINVDDVLSSDYYFILWLPKNRATGLLVVQGTSRESAGNLFKVLVHFTLNKYFGNKTIELARFTSKKDVENFKKKSEASKIVLSRNEYSSDEANDILGVDIATDDVKFKIIIEGKFNTQTLSDIIYGGRGKRIAKSSKIFTSELLENVNFGENDFYSTDITFKDKKNKKSAVAKSNSGFEIKPFVYLDGDIERDKKTKKFKRDSIKKAVNNYFLTIKSEV